MSSLISSSLFYGSEEKEPIAFLLRVDDYTILCDAGINTNFTQTKLQLLFEHVLGEIDAVLLSSSDLAHCGAVPFLGKQKNLRCPIYCTLPTRLMGELNILDLVQSYSPLRFPLYSSSDVISSFSSLHTLKSSEEVTLNKKQIHSPTITITPFKAGHVLGGTFWRITRDSDSILYTADYHHAKERHLDGGYLIAFSRPSILILDCFNARRVIPSRRDRDSQVWDIVMSTIKSGGICLFPVDAAGRVLELLMLLDAYWQSLSTEFRSRVPFIFASPVAADTLSHARTQIEWMSESIVKSFMDGGKEGPFQMKYLSLASSLDQVYERTNDLTIPSIILATDYTLDTSFAQTLFIKLSNSNRNTIVLTQSVTHQENTLAEQLIGIAQAQNNNPLTSTQTVTAIIRRDEPLMGEELKQYRMKQRRQERQTKREEKERITQHKNMNDMEIEEEEEDEEEIEEENEAAEEFELGREENEDEELKNGDERGQDAAEKLIKEKQRPIKKEATTEESSKPINTLQPFDLSSNPLSNLNYQNPTNETEPISLHSSSLPVLPSLSSSTLYFPRFYMFPSIEPKRSTDGYGELIDLTNNSTINNTIPQSSASTGILSSSLSALLLGAGKSSSSNLPADLNKPKPPIPENEQSILFPSSFNSSNSSVTTAPNNSEKEKKEKEKEKGEGAGVDRFALLRSDSSTSSLPTKCVFSSVPVEVSSRIAFIDLEGRNDGRSLKMILSQVQPLTTVAIHGTREDKTTIQNYLQQMNKTMAASSNQNQNTAQNTSTPSPSLSSSPSSVFLPSNGVLCEISSTSTVSCSISPLLFSQLTFDRVGSNYQVAVIKGTALLPTPQQQQSHHLPIAHTNKFTIIPTQKELQNKQNRSLEKPNSIKEEEEEKEEKEERNSPLSVPPIVYLGNPRISEFPLLFSTLPVPLDSELLYSNVYLNERSIRLSKRSANHLHLEGEISEEYFRARQEIYKKYNLCL